MKLFLNNDMSEFLEENKAKQRAKRHSQSIGIQSLLLAEKQRTKTARTTTGRRRRRSKAKTRIRARKSKKMHNTPKKETATTIKHVWELMNNNHALQGRSQKSPMINTAGSASQSRRIEQTILQENPFGQTMMLAPPSASLCHVALHMISPNPRRNPTISSCRFAGVRDGAL
jgi:hypothetical protein